MNEKSSRSLLALASSFAALFSALYLLGSWSSFDIPILEFASLSDMVGLAVYPALGSFLMLMLALLLVKLLDRTPAVRHYDPEMTARLRARATRNQRIATLLSAVVLLVVSTAGPEPGKWLFVAICTTFLLTPVLEPLFPRAWIPDDELRKFVLLGAVFSLGMAFAIGRSHAYFIQRGNADAVVDLERSQLDLNGDSGKPVEYLGHIGEYYILYETATSSVVLVAAKEQKKLFLRHNPRHVMRILG